VLHRGAVRACVIGAVEAIGILAADARSVVAVPFSVVRVQGVPDVAVPRCTTAVQAGFV